MGNITRIGDRWRDTFDGEVIEVVCIVDHETSRYRVIVPSTAVGAGEGRGRIGYEEEWDNYFPDTWEYIGNFGKSDSFTELYNKLNDEK
jgi:hypothetical protein